MVKLSALSSQRDDCKTRTDTKHHTTKQGSNRPTKNKTNSNNKKWGPTINSESTTTEWTTAKATGALLILQVKPLS